MFESLREGLSSALRSLSGRGKLTEANMREGLGMVESALLEADVSYEAVKAFMKRVSEKACGEEVLKQIDPTQQVVKIVYDELVELMGPVDNDLHLKGSGITTIMMCGLQGSGKTTTTGKLGKRIQVRGRRPMFVAADLQRPAAIKQLETLGEQLNIPVFADYEEKDPVKVCARALEMAKAKNCDVVILDTAGRLHVDEELMAQLVRIDQQCSPDQVYLVVDGMTGQDAVNSAKAFNEALELDGVIMTKLDGDSRAGAAISLKHVTGVPIKFIGTGEQVTSSTSLEDFTPEGMASRILGGGDLQELLRQAQTAFDQNVMEEQEARLKKGIFTFNDFQTMMAQTRRLGSFGKILSFLPGMGNLKQLLGNTDADAEMNKINGIINSMTKEERENPKCISPSRARRIAGGSGVHPQQVLDLIKQFNGMAEMMKMMSGMGAGGRIGAMQELMRRMQQGPAGLANAAGSVAKGNTGKRLTPAEKAKMRKLREKEMKKRKKG
ncbi:MAG: signal recognition particle protein [Planctomycetaceae bacterium]|nr:signal recognition particle protein [Planctomycetaceae bacterium]MBQ2822933.1 signal recognition particle protein [Thermoguttaceae bacterium]